MGLKHQQSVNLDLNIRTLKLKDQFIKIHMSIHFLIEIQLNQYFYFLMFDLHRLNNFDSH